MEPDLIDTGAPEFSGTVDEVILKLSDMKLLDIDPLTPLVVVILVNLDDLTDRVTGYLNNPDAVYSGMVIRMSRWTSHFEVVGRAGSLICMKDLRHAAQRRLAVLDWQEVPTGRRAAHRAMAKRRS